MRNYKKQLLKYLFIVYITLCFWGMVLSIIHLEEVCTLEKPEDRSNLQE